MTTPRFWSSALAEIADPDWTHVAVDVLPARADADPAAWARRLAAPASLPSPARALALARLLATPRPRPRSWCPSLRHVRRVGEEVLLGRDGARWDLRVAVGVDEPHALVRVVSVVRLKGTHARALSWPARVALGYLVPRLLRRSRRAMAGTD